MPEIFQEMREVGFGHRRAATDCSIDLDSKENPDFPPFIVDSRDNLVVANGTRNKRSIDIKKGDSITLYCPNEKFKKYSKEPKLSAK